MGTTKLESKEETKDFIALFRRTDKENPKPEDVTALRHFLETDTKLHRVLGNISGRVFSSVLAEATKNSVVFRQCVEKYAKEMKTEMGYQSSTFVEKLLIDEIVMRWLKLSVMDNLHQSATSGSHSTSEGMYYDKRLHLAQARFLKAIEMLAKVRKMIANTQAKGAEMFKTLIEANDASKS